MVATHRAMVVGRIEPNGVRMLGTCFILNADGLVATPYHVVGPSDDKLVVIPSGFSDINDYQDLSDNSCSTSPVKIANVDPARDIAILQMSVKPSFPLLPPLGSIDDANVGDQIEILGYPHCTEGRRALTLQRAEIGAKVLLDNNKLKSKHGVLNTQARPGQSGSFIFHPGQKKVIGMLIGAWVPGPGGISLGGINPRELHQTTHCVSAHHIAEMIS